MRKSPSFPSKYLGMEFYLGDLSVHQLTNYGPYKQPIDIRTRVFYDQKLNK